MYVAKFFFDPNKYDTSILEHALHEIRLKDATFKYSINKTKDGIYILNIYAQNKDQAHKRAMWIRDKLFANGVGYIVKEVRK